MFAGFLKESKALFKKYNPLAVLSTLVILLALPLTFFLLQHQQILTQRASGNEVVFVDDNNNTITQTASPSVRVKLTAPWPIASVGFTTSVAGVSTQNGDGLNATYYNNIDFTGTTFQRKDPVINFNWGNSSPAPNIAAHTFSVRWIGFVVPSKSGYYTFYAKTGDGVRFWINNVEIINNWRDHKTYESKGSISLTAGTVYPIKMEYYDDTGPAVAILSWSASSVSKQIIPQTNLYTQSPNSPTSTPSPISTNTPVPPTPTATPTPSPTPTPTTQSIILSEDPNFISNVVSITPNTNPTTANYVFSDSSLGTKTLFVKFKASTGEEQLALGTIQLIAPPKLTSPYLDFSYTYHTSTDGATGSNSYSLTSPRITTGDNRLLLVTVSYRQNNSVSSVTVNGTPITLLTRALAPDRKQDVWYMINPPSGTANVAINFPASEQSLVAGVNSFYNVNQTSPLGSPLTNTGDSGNVSVSASTDANDVAFGVLSSYDVIPNIQSPASQIFQDETNSRWIISSAATSPGTGSIVNFNWASSTCCTWSAAAVAIKPPTGSTQLPLPSPTPTPFPSPIPVPKTTYYPKVLAIALDPTDASGDIDTKYFNGLWSGWGATDAAGFEDKVFNQAVSDFKTISNNNINYNIVKKIRLTNFPAYYNANPYTVSNYANCKQNINLPNGLSCEQQKAQLDTVSWFDQNNICQTAQSVGADEIWVISPPWILRWESFMIGPTYGFPVNGDTYIDVNCKKQYIIVNPTYDRPDLFLHSYGHRVEAIMNYVTSFWNANDKQKYWENFANMNRTPAPTVGCGNTHFPFNASAGYDYSNTTVKSFDCPDWNNFPNLQGATENINCTAWGCSDSGWQKHWLSSLPSSADAVQMLDNSGNPFYFRKDWWYYILSPDNAIAFHNNPSVLGASTQASTQTILDQLLLFLSKLRLN